MRASFALLALLAAPPSPAAATLPPGYASAQAQGKTVVFVRPRAADAPRERAAVEVALHACAREAQEQLTPDVRVLELSAPTEVRAVGSAGEPLPSRLLVNGAFYGAVFFWDAKKPDVHEQRLDCADVLARAHTYFREPPSPRSPPP